MDEFDFVAVRVFHEGDNGTAVFHRAGFAHHFAAFGAHGIAGCVGVFHFDGDVAVGVAEVVAGGIPVVGEFEHGGFVFAAVADEGEGEAAVGVVFAAQEFHAEHFLVEGEGGFEVADAQHGVEDSHGLSLVGVC